MLDWVIGATIGIIHGSGCDGMEGKVELPFSRSMSFHIPFIFFYLEIRKVIYETAISKPDQRIEIIGIKTI